MTNKPDSIKTLRRFYRDRLAVVNLGDLQSELMGASDRSIVITLGAFLDGAIEFLIAQNTRPQSTQPEFEDAFGINGPLGSFSARIEVAYLFRLIDESVRGQLNVIRELRNACAHSKRPISFATLELANVCKRVLHPVGMFRLRGDSAEDLKSAFTAECLLLHNVLIFGRDAAVKMVEASYREAGKQSPFAANPNL
jgi:hypothetical protein